MANVCDFGLTIKGPESKLSELKAFLTSALEACPGGYYGNFVLCVNQLWPDIDKEGEHTFVGLDDCRKGRPTTGPTAEADEYVLHLGGASKWCPPLRLMERLSGAFPEVDFHLAAITEDEFQRAVDRTEWRMHAVELCMGRRTIEQNKNIAERVGDE